MDKIENHKLSKSAEKDLNQLIEKGKQNWEGWRVESYTVGLDQSLNLLVAFPEMGSPVESRRYIDLRKWRYERHIIFYRPRPEQGDLFVIRIFDAKQNYHAYFG